jgi:ribosomal-protein-alanine N-acetyltransferase
MNARQSCTLVPYAAEHLEGVSQIDKRCFIDPWFKRAFIDKLNAPCALNLVAVSHDDTACTMGYCLGRVIIDECTINRLAVHPDYQRGGIASHILKKFLHNAGLQGAHNCFIDVRASNTAARCLYEGHGFHRIGIRNSYYQIDAEDALIISCAIPTAHYSKTLQQE